ncbi:hypothetical protein RJ639_023524 [Escallonia herrerae]|uniref:Uncharacterized protein n=1 Tax=Escallonia herrerae TaxID=1293975 RepID=A0AA88V135_9ASTE|nr:hypothetical protein RJ639_023524 [Escallonia herrerae]
MGKLKALTAAVTGIDEGYREAYQGQILKIYSAYEPVTGQRPTSTIIQSQYQFTRPPKTTFRINPREDLAGLLQLLELWKESISSQLEKEAKKLVMITHSTKFEKTKAHCKKLLLASKDDTIPRDFAL